MHILKPFVLVAALVAATTADAEPICDAINHAARIGARDYHFAAFRRDVPAPEGFTCRIVTEGRLGAYACSTPVAPEARAAKARALIETVRACVRSSLIVEKSPKEADTIFIISRSPPSWVMVSGADVGDPQDATRVNMYVVVYRPRRPAGAPSEDRPLVGQSFGSTDAAPYIDYNPHDPGLEKPW